MRVNISIDDELLQRMDAAAKKMYISRSAYISFVVSQRLQADSAMENLPEFISTAKAVVAESKANRKREKREK